MSSRSLRIPALCAFALLGATACKVAPDGANVSTSNVPAIAVVAETPLEEIVSEYEAMFRAGRIGGLIDYLPPKITSSLSQQYDVSEPELRAALQEVWDESLETVTVEKFEFDMEAKPIETLPDGTQYKLIPTYMRLGLVANANEIIDTTSETLAFAEGNRWYLVRLDDPDQIKMFHQNYPAFSSLEIEPQTMVQRQRSTQE